MTKSKRKEPVRPHAIVFTEPTKTQQHFTAGCDVNNIVNLHAQTGLDPNQDRKNRMRFGHASGQSFTEAMFKTAEIQSAFNELPSSERASFDNNPAAWLDSFQPDPEPDVPSAAPEEPETPVSEPPKPIEGGELDIT